MYVKMVIRMTIHYIATFKPYNLASTKNNLVIVFWKVLEMRNKVRKKN